MKGIGLYSIRDGLYRCKGPIGMRHEDNPFKWKVETTKKLLILGLFSKIRGKDSLFSFFRVIFASSIVELLTNAFLA